MLGRPIWRSFGDHDGGGLVENEIEEVVELKVKSRRSNDAFLEFSRADPTPNSSAYATTNMRDDTTQTRGAKWKLANINVPHGHGHGQATLRHIQLYKIRIRL